MLLQTETVKQPTPLWQQVSVESLGSLNEANEDATARPVLAVKLPSAKTQSLSLLGKSLAQGLGEHSLCPPYGGGGGRKATADVMQLTNITDKCLNSSVMKIMAIRHN